MFQYLNFWFLAETNVPLVGFKDVSLDSEGQLPVEKTVSDS